MARYRGTVKLAMEDDLSEELDRRRRKVDDEVDRLTEGYLMQVNEEDLVQHLTQTHSIDVPALDPNQVSASVSEQLVPAEAFGRLYNVEPGRSYPANVVEYAIPFSGEIRLLAYRASTFSFGYDPEVAIAENAISFEIRAIGNDPARVESEYNDRL